VKSTLRAVCLAAPMSILLALASASTGRTDTVKAEGSTPTPSFYVSLADVNEIGVVDPSTGEIEAVLPFKSGLGGPIEMIVDPARPIVYVVLGNQHIVAFQTKYQIPLGSVSLPAQCFSYAINSSGSKIYVSACGGQTVYVADTKTFTLTSSIQMPSNVSGIAISTRRHRLYATLPTIHSVATIDTDNNQIERVKYLGQCRLNACSGGEAVVSPDDRYLILLDQKQCETIDYDLETARILGRNPDQVSEQCGIIGMDAFANELWLSGGEGKFAGISMAPPFNQIATFQYRAQIESVSFSPSGQGFAVGDGPEPYFRSNNFLFPFPSFSRKVTLWSTPASILYVP
jgi:hypothetical protein